MTPKSLFTILLKFAALYFIFNFLILIPTDIAYIYSSFILIKSDNITWTIITMAIIILFCYAGIVYVCLYKTDFVIDKLSLDKHFEEERLELNIHRSTILSIIIIVFGGLLFIDALPALFKEALRYREEREMFSAGGQSTYWTVYYLVKALLGILLIWQHRFIVNFIELKRKNQL